MQEPDDIGLLREYAEHNSEEAFARLVTRHINLVYSVALRHVGNPHNAEEITQAVFIILAKKAAQLRHAGALSSWLFQATRLTASNFVRSETRRHRREQEAHMQSALNEPEGDTWARIVPWLDTAVAGLGEKDRRAIVLRFYEGRNLREIGLTLGTNEDAAGKRVIRAVEKLRLSFMKRGMVLPAAALAAAISAHSVQAAPAALAKSVTAVAAAKGSATAASTLTLVKGALKLMAWTKIQTAAVVGAVILLAGGTTTVIVKAVAQSNDEPTIDKSLWKADPRTLQKVPPVLIVRPTQFAGGGANLDAGDKAVLLNAPISGLLGVAYGFPESRIVFSDNPPKERFDLMLTLPDHPREALQAEIKKRFGLAGHPEVREVDVLQLKVRNAQAPGLARSNGGKSGSLSSSLSSVGAVPPDVAAKFRGLPGTNSGNQVTIKNQMMSDLARYFEKRLGRQVMDRTGTTDRFDFKFQVQPQNGESQEDAFKRAVFEQLGLELEPGRESVEMLVVEKAKDEK